MSVKIGSKTSTYANASFTFSPSPKAINFNNFSKKKLIDQPYKSIIPYLNFNSVSSLIINMSGYFEGASKESDLTNLSNLIYSKNMKKLYLDDSNFVYFITGEIKNSKIGKRFNFRDYTVSFISPIPFILSTSRNYSVTGVSSGITLNDSTSNSTGSFTNSGNAPAIIQKITITHSSGTITEVSIGDLAYDSGVQGDNIITWTGSLTTGSIILELLYEVDNKGVKWYYYDSSDDSTTNGSRKLTGDNPEDGPAILPDTSDQDFSISVTGGTVDVSFEWYDSNYRGLI